MVYVTLLSDLGLRDASVAVVKGILMLHTHDLDIVDITHDITPFNTRQAAYLLGSAYKNFPAGTYHILLFDLFSEKSPLLLLCEYEGHYFLSPDNGSLPLALGAPPANAWQCTALKKGDTFNDWLKAIGNTINSFQTKQTGSPDLLPYQPKTILHSLKHIQGASIIECEVIHIDRYQNVVINMTRQQFEDIGRGRQFRLQFMQLEEISEISNNYSDAREGYKLCRFNSNNYLEICINRGKAASLFGLRLGGKNNDVKIFFE